MGWKSELPTPVAAPPSICAHPVIPQQLLKAAKPQGEGTKKITDYPHYLEKEQGKTFFKRLDDVLVKNQ